MALFLFSPSGEFSVGIKTMLARPCLSPHPIYLKPCTHFGYLVISETSMKMSFLLTWYMACSFTSAFCDLILFSFSTVAQHLCKEFYAFTSNVLYTLRQYIWSILLQQCLYIKASRGIKQCVCSLGESIYFPICQRDVFKVQKSLQAQGWGHSQNLAAMPMHCHLEMFMLLSLNMAISANLGYLT